MTDRDDLDPADWLAQQFGEDPEPVVPPKPAVPPAPAPTPPPPAPPTPAPPAPAPTAPAPTAPVAPTPPPTPAAPPNPAAPPVPPENRPGAPFQWGLTPGSEQAAPEQPTTPPPVGEPSVPPVVPPAPPVAPPAPSVAPPPVVPPVLPPPPLAAPPAVPPADVPTQAFSFEDLPTTAVPAAPPANHGHDLDTVAFDAASWNAAPVDPALEGVTEVIEAELVGLAAPEGEGVQATAIDNLFGAAQFQEYDDKALVPVLPTRPTGEGKPPRGPMSRTQKILLWVAGGLLAVLVLIGLFMLGKSVADSVGPAPAVTESPTPTPTPTLTALPIGPLPPGEHQWDALLGGECLAPWESAWQETYIVVDCTTPHPAQMVFRGTFDDPADAVYPGVEELQKRMNVLCTPTTVIDYSKAGLANDIQVSASFAADAADWDEGNRTFFCFVSRSSAQNFTESIAVPQVAPAPAP